MSNVVRYWSALQCGDRVALVSVLAGQPGFEVVEKVLAPNMAKLTLELVPEADASVGPVPRDQAVKAELLAELEAERARVERLGREVQRWRALALGRDDAAPVPAALLALPPPPDTLTHRQRTVLRFIAERIAEYGRPPTVREIAEAMGTVSNNAIQDHLRALERKGCITREPKLARSIRVLVDALGSDPR